MKNNDVIIKVDGLKKSFGNNEILKGISTEIRRGEVVVILGPSGCGKSTFLRCLNLLEIPSEGSIVFDDVELTSPSTNINEQREKIMMVFQHFNLFPHLTILENLTIAPKKLKKIPKEEINKKAMELLEVFGLENEASTLADNLPYGKQSKLEIARALATNPKLLLLDEPATMACPKTKQEILDAVKKINEELNITVIVVSPAEIPESLYVCSPPTPVHPCGACF